MLMLGCKRLSQPELVPISKATKRVVTPTTWTPCPEQVLNPLYRIYLVSSVVLRW